LFFSFRLSQIGGRAILYRRQWLQGAIYTIDSASPSTCSKPWKERKGGFPVKIEAA
jgi:hypothetical protein